MVVTNASSQTIGSNFKGKPGKIDLLLDPCRWDRQAAPKRLQLPTNKPSAISQKNEDLDNNISGHTTELTTPMYLIILTTVTLASSNNALPDDDDCTETCRSCFHVNFNVNFKIIFKTIHLCINQLVNKKL
jgi:hypothetical protein